jgi:type 1 glutamine amidotransferase
MEMRKSFFGLAAVAVLFGTWSAAQSAAQTPATNGGQTPKTAATEQGCPAPGERRFPPRPAGEGGGPPMQAPPAATAQSGPPKKHLLIWADTRNGIAQHDIAHAEAVIEEMGYTSGLWDSYIRTDSNIIAKRPRMTTGEPASGGPSLCNVDAIFFLGHREIDLDAQGRSDLLWFVHDQGKGFVLAHTGVGAFESWPEFNDMIGGQYDDHPWGTTTAKLIVNDPHFPGMEFKTGEEFKDEFYQLKNFRADQIHVVLSLDTSNLDMTRQAVHSRDAFALAYAKIYGKGRVFYSTFAHAPATWDDPHVRDLYMGAIKWALGLVDSDVAPNPGAAPIVPAKRANP